MNWMQLQHLVKNEAWSTKMPPVILEYQIEGQTAKEFYQRERENKPSSRPELEFVTTSATRMLSE